MTTNQTNDNCNIERCTANDNFSIIPNEILQHPTMSSDAQAVLTYLLSCKSDWVIKPKNVWKAKNISRDHVYKAFDELIDLGYMDRITTMLGNLKSSTKYKVSYLKKFLRRPESRDTESRGTETQDALIRKIKKKNNQEKEFVVEDPCGSPAIKIPEESSESKDPANTSISIKTSTGALKLNHTDLFQRALSAKAQYNTDELRYAWKTLGEYSGIVYDWWKFIIGTIEKYRMGVKSKNAARNTHREPAKEAAKPVYKTQSKKSVMDLMNEKIAEQRAEREKQHEKQSTGITT